MDDKKRLEILAEVMELEEDELTPEMEVEELECWDSMTRLSLIVMMDDQFGKKITGEQVRAFKTVRDIMNCMEKN